MARNKKGGTLLLRTKRKSADRSALLSFAVGRCSDSSGNFARPQAPGAGVNTAGLAIDQSLDLHHVGFPGSVGTSVRVRHFDTESNVFSAEITFSHFLHLL